MRQNAIFWRVILICMAAIMSVGMAACSSDDPDAPTPNTTSKHKGKVEFSINLPSGSGAGTGYSPAVVNKGDTLSVAITQKSSYKDPDGSVFSCEPKANIVVYAKTDTVYAKDLAALTQVRNTATKTDKTGSSPVVNQTVQTFEIGDQSVVFDLSYEVYTYTNSKQESVEMPYIKPNQAKVGNKASTEEMAGSRSAIAVTGITVRPIEISRGATVTDTTMYEVNVRFNLDVESVNASQDAKQTLEFSVSYVGGVETVTKLKDPVSELSYEWSVKSGTANTAPPFVLTRGKAMEVWMAQSSAYTDEYGNKATASPTAKIRLAAKQDIVWVSSVDELKSLADLTGEIAPGQSATQRFGNDLQEISIDWSYESGEALIAGQTVDMPYYVLEPAKLKDVSVKELRDDEINGKECTLYEVTATFSQKAVAENLLGSSSEVEIEYVVKYIGALEIKIVMVEYKRGGDWEDPHDNMALAYFAYVERYRTYSNGKRIGPDRFEDYGHFIQLGFHRMEYEEFVDLGDDWIYPGPAHFTNIGDSIQTKTKSLELSRLYDFYRVPSPVFDGFLRDDHIGDWDKYWPSYDYSDESFNLCKGVYCPDEWPEDSRPNGWYFREFFYEHRNPSRFKFHKEDDDVHMLSCGGICFYFHDQFLVIDGRRIDFSSLRNLKIDFRFSDERFSDPDKEVIVSKTEMDASLYDKKFYAARIDTAYVKK